MFTIQNAVLWFDRHPILTGVPQGVSLRADPAGAGAFVHLEPEEATARWTFPLGVPTATLFTAAHRYEPFWMRPAIVETSAGIPVETQVLFTRQPDGRVAIFVPLMDRITRCSLEGGSDNQLCVTAESGSKTISAAGLDAVFVAVQPEDEALNAFLARCATAVAAHLGIPLRHEKKLPAFVDVLGWCTWDAFYQEVSPEKIRHGLESFQQSGVPVGFLIVDDGWQSVRDFGEEKGKRLTALVPNEKFGGDFSATVRMAKKEFGVKCVLAWHAFAGYWAGADVEAFAGYGAREVRRNFSEGILRHCPEANTKWWGASAGVIPAEHAGRFFNDYHTLLRSQGIDGVKVDNQAALEGLLNAGETRGEVYGGYREASRESVLKHFGGNVLHCMSCANDLLYSPGGCLTRTSTDFWPNKPETHGLHLWTNALVSLWFGHFVHPDWDMFQSTPGSPDWGRFHGAARAISGGPVYVSDQPGKHGVELLRSLAFSDGSIPRCDQPATLAAECLFRDPTREDALLKVVNTYRNGAAGVVALFNCRHDPQNRMAAVTGTVSPSDIPEIGGHARYLVSLRGPSDAEGLVSQDPKAIAHDEAIEISLRQAEFEIATIVPIEDGLAVVGLLELFNTAATASLVARDTSTIRISTRDAGTLGVWVEHRVADIECDGKRLKWDSLGNWHWGPVPHAGEVVVRLA